jgi:hypothetical protein
MPVPLSYLKKKEGVFVRPILSFALFALRHPFMYRSGVVFFSFLARYIFCRVHCWGGWGIPGLILYGTSESSSDLCCLLGGFQDEMDPIEVDSLFFGSSSSSRAPISGGADTAAGCF